MKTRTLVHTAFLALVTLLPGATHANDSCEAVIERTRPTGILSTHTQKGWAEMDLSETQEGVLNLNVFSVESSGIPQLGKITYSELKNVSIQLERLPNSSVESGSRGDLQLRRHRLHLFSERGMAVVELIAGGLQQQILEIELDDSISLEKDPFQLPVNEILQLMGFKGILKEAALKSLHSACASQQRLESIDLLKHLLNGKMAGVPDLGCPPCHLESRPTVRPAPIR
jgi:hypothetical protein